MYIGYFYSIKLLINHSYYNLMQLISHNFNFNIINIPIYRYCQFIAIKIEHFKNKNSIV